ncbi:MAG: response regulator [Hydrococcus sp. C42_A2020_068]|nr:response regulator [Hydrococcus sp. C42_A2020_068]
MTLDPDFHDQAYYLFVEEALELLQQIQETLLKLPDDLSLTNVYGLVRAASTIKSGAAQVKLTDIYTLADRFENFFRRVWQEKLIVDPELADLLWQAYECLRQSLLTQIQADREEGANAIAKAEPIFTRLEAYLTPVPDELEELLALDDDLEEEEHQKEAEEETESLLNQEVLQALANLEAILSRPETSNLATALMAQIEEFLSLGELLEISEFVAVAQITLATLQVSPQTAPTIGQLALAGFRGIWKATVKSSLTTKVKQEDLWDAEIPAAEQFLELERERAVSPIAGAQETLSKERKLKTANSLVWLAGSAAFVVSCQQVREILLAQGKCSIDASGRQWLHWQDSDLPLYRLSELLEYNSPLPVGIGGTTDPSDLMVVVLDLGWQTIAVELAVDRLMAVPELVIKPFGSAIAPPSYCAGCAILEDKNLVAVIDVEALLAQKLDRMPIAVRAGSKPAPATILVIDDSSTSRRVLVLTLQKAGYRVIQAQDGKEGMRQLLQNPAVDSIVSDIEMPNLNGFGVLKSCRQNSQLAKVPVILISTYNSDRHRRLARELGAAGYLSKPFDERKLLAMLDAILKQKVR